MLFQINNRDVCHRYLPLEAVLEVVEEHEICEFYRYFNQPITPLKDQVRTLVTHLEPFTISKVNSNPFSLRSSLRPSRKVLSLFHRRLPSFQLVVQQQYHLANVSRVFHQHMSVLIRSKQVLEMLELAR